eukprot:3157735-Prymnesium_polylepis.1
MDGSCVPSSVLVRPRASRCFVCRNENIVRPTEHEFGAIRVLPLPARTPPAPPHRSLARSRGRSRLSRSAGLDVPMRALLRARTASFLKHVAT